MSTKEKILSVVQTLPDDVSIDEAIGKLYLLHKVEIGIEQAEKGEVCDHDEFMKQLLDEWRYCLSSTAPGF